MSGSGDWKIRYLHESAICPQLWKESWQRGSTIDSFLGTSHTCKALAEFCLNHLGLDYVLLGAFESDPVVSVSGGSAISVIAVLLAQTFVRRKLLHSRRTAG
ncbi:MAG: hypothetical protein GY820_42300 [Gammaproteobacteria bacterium]|nr:hypothetical protein [Gammaproteobacteria bacterium]